MDLKEISEDVLVEMKQSLEHARDNRPGGLLHGEKIALRNINTELDRRKEDTVKCRLGYCAIKDSHYEGGDDTVRNKLKKGICPICGGPTEKKY